LGGGSIETLPKFGYRFAYPVALLPTFADSHVLSEDSTALSAGELDSHQAPAARISVEESLPPPAIHEWQSDGWLSWMIAAMSLTTLTIAGVLFTSSRATDRAHRSADRWKRLADPVVG
jgi:hypothetical protein